MNSMNGAPTSRLEMSEMKAEAKKCCRCLIEKTRDQFSRLSYAKDGLSYHCKQCKKEEKAKWRKQNPEKARQAVRDWRAKNPEKAAEGNRRRARNWNNRNKEKRAKMNNAWFDKNPGVKALYGAARRMAVQIQSLPLSEEQRAKISEIYRNAKILSIETGIKYHVDHIIPLRAKNCSGLHVPWNLQIISASENVKKNNRVPDATTGAAFL
jgi:hypothetical protein